MRKVFEGFQTFCPSDDTRNTSTIRFEPLLTSTRCWITTSPLSNTSIYEILSFIIKIEFDNQLTISLLVITCRRSSRSVFNGVNGSRMSFRWLLLFVLLKLLQLNIDVDDAFLFNEQIIQKRNSKIINLHLWTLIHH